MERGLKGWQQYFRFISEDKKAGQTYLPEDIDYYINELGQKVSRDFEQEIDNGFEREERYIVLKNKDIYNFLSPLQKAQLENIRNTINYFRGSRGPVKCVVVEYDWPEYELTWKMIEDRVVRSRSKNVV